ncbi:MAG: CopD family protein [Acidimicrobiales bacterium]
MALPVLLGPVLALTATPVSAHSVLESSSPEAGTVLDSAPSEITLTFNEAVSLTNDSVRLLDVNGRTVATGRPVAVDNVVRTSVPTTLARGSYIVAWKVTSADSHPVSGAFTFAVGAASTASDGSSADDVAARAEPSDAGPQSLVDIAGVLAYAGILAAVGSAMALTDATPTLPAGRIRRVVGGAAAVGVVALSLGVLAEAVLLDGAGIRWPGGSSIWRQLTAAPGLQWALGVIGLIALVVLTRRAAERSLVVLAGLVAVSGLIVVGHTRTATPVVVTMIADVVHLAAAAVWTGGLLALVLELRASGDDPGERAGAVARFSGIATVAIVAVVVTGSVMAWRILGSWSALFHTTYGVLLMVKVGLFVVVAAIGGYNRVRLVDRVSATDDETSVPAGARLLRRTMTAELAVIAVIVGLTGVLTSASPESTAGLTPLQIARRKCLAEVAAMSQQPGMEGMSHACPGDPPTSTTVFDPTASGAAEGSAAFGDGRAVITADPGRVGSNTVDVELRDATGQLLDTAQPPVLEFRLRARQIGPITQTATRVGPGLYRVTQDLPLAGTWEVNVSAVVSDFVQPQGIVTLTIGA